MARVYLDQFIFIRSRIKFVLDLRHSSVIESFPQTSCWFEKLRYVFASDDAACTEIFVRRLNDLASREICEGLSVRANIRADHNDVLCSSGDPLLDKHLLMSVADHFIFLREHLH